MKRLKHRATETLFEHQLFHDDPNIVDPRPWAQQQREDVWRDVNPSYMPQEAHPLNRDEGDITEVEEPDNHHA